MPQPLRRMWPGARRKRRVRLQMLVWWGIGRHYHTSLEEEDNSVWDGEQWCVPWNDQEGKGQHLNDIFVTEKAARNWVRRMMRKHFPKHRLVRGYSHGTPKWFYREGD